MHTVFPGEGPRAIGMVAGCQPSGWSLAVVKPTALSNSALHVRHRQPWFLTAEVPLTFLRSQKILRRGRGVQGRRIRLRSGRHGAVQGWAERPAPAPSGPPLPGRVHGSLFFQKRLCLLPPDSEPSCCRSGECGVGKSAPAPGVCCSQAANKRLRCLAVSYLPRGATAPCLSGDRLPASCGPRPLAAPRRPLCRCPPLPRHQGILVE